MQKLVREKTVVIFTDMSLLKKKPYLKFFKQSTHIIGIQINLYFRNSTGTDLK